MTETRRPGVEQPVIYAVPWEISQNSASGQQETTQTASADRAHTTASAADRMCIVSAGIVKAAVCIADPDTSTDDRHKSIVQARYFRAVEPGTSSWLGADGEEWERRPLETCAQERRWLWKNSSAQDV